MRNPLPLAVSTASGLGKATKVAVTDGPGLGRDYGRLHLASAIQRLRRRQPPFHGWVDGLDLEFFDYGNLFLLVDEIIVERCYDAELTHPRLIVDVGANIGLATLRLARQHPSAEIMAIEPEPRTYALLERNVRMNDLSDRVILHQVAVDDIEGIGEMHAGPVAGDVHAALRDDGISVHSANSFTVPIRRLSTLIGGREVDYLKLDIEGRETAVLPELARSGTLDTIKRLTCEVHLSSADDGVLTDILALLHRHHFRTELARPSLPGVVLLRAAAVRPPQ